MYEAPAHHLSQCSATLHVLCLIRSKLHDLKRQRKERVGELLQVIPAVWHTRERLNALSSF
jgi:hypothetical protein